MLTNMAKMSAQYKKHPNFALTNKNVDETAKRIIKLIKT